MTKYQFNTNCVQGTYKPKPGEPRVLPIVQSTTFSYDDSDYVADLFDFNAEGSFYTRLGNPTTDSFEGKMNLLEGGVGALAVSSGQSASFFSIVNICQAGDHVISSANIYGGTFNLFDVSLRKLGIDFTFVDPDSSEEEILSCVKPNTKALFGETIANPGMNVLDFVKFSSIAKKLDIPFIVDNTLATPYLCRPFELGANIIIHSATKYTDGHATSVGGIIIDGGNFNWENGKFPCLTEPDPSYHGMKYVEKFGPAAYIIKARGQLIRDYGCTPSPFNAFMFHLGLETLHLRMERHSENALKLAEFLSSHPSVSWVKYPGLKSDPYFDLAQKYMPKGASGILSFGIKGGAKAGKELIKHLDMVQLVVHLGDLRTSILHPASTTHRQLSEQQQIESGILPEMIRVSVGIEDINDIMNDFDKALRAVTK
ncbi:MAG: O-acetylhomoserine aminocarboxypropyltransferase/cysteine synthase [Clostridia bacterium]|nr:O-acetylhomoserine aminocarboxypropyltransferase/cysteine synthase [Clostridia bacterium]